MANADLAYQHALNQLSVVGFDSLSERERDLVMLRQVEAAVNNGGFVRYYSTAVGDQAFLAPEALARIGATGKAAIVRAANSLFGPAGPPCNRQDRVAALEFFSLQVLCHLDSLEQRYYEDPADVDELVEGSMRVRG